MAEFKLIITTPDGILYDGMAESAIVRTLSGDVGILKGRAPYIAALGVGKSRFKINGEWKLAACSGGVINADSESVKIAATTFEWADEIDISRAESAMEKAQKVIDSSDNNRDIDKARIKLHRAITRINVANEKI